MKRSKQREAILEVLCSTTSHPTADWIYNRVREFIPSISLGTVYRNLGILSKNGDILKLDVGSDQSHYDGTTIPHDHVVCQSCNRVFDVNTKYDNSIDNNVRDLFEGSIDYHTLLYYGTCVKCKNNESFNDSDLALT